MSYSPDLPRVAESELHGLRSRIITSLIREGLEYNSQRESLGYSPTEFVNIPDFDTMIDRKELDREMVSGFILEGKNELNEITTNHLTGMILWGKWKDSEPDYSASLALGSRFIEVAKKRIFQRRVQVNSEAQAHSTLMLALSQEYMRVKQISFQDSLLATILISAFQDKLPQYLPLWAEPVDILDIIFSQFVIDLSIKGKLSLPSLPETTPVSANPVKLNVGGYQDWLTGKYTLCVIIILLHKID